MKKEFNQLGLSNKLVKATEELYFKEATHIQKEVIPLILDGKNIIGQSETGSGKTHAFLLPLVEKVELEKEVTQIVITVPTRELAMQINYDLETLLELSGLDDITTRLVTGGLDRERMMKQLQITPQIVVGTPGRILDMVNAQALSIYTAVSFVIDEADLMLDLGFLNELDQLLVRSNEHVQTLVFSATIPDKLEHFFKKYLKQPEHIQIESDLTPRNIEHLLIEVRHRSVSELIGKVSKVIQPYIAIVFANNKEKADKLFSELKALGLNVGILHGGLSARERKRMVQAIRDLKYEYIVATDLASRGIDIPGVSHVINADLPIELDFYIHRVGRTARAGNEGMAINFFEEQDEALVLNLENRGVQFKYVDITADGWVERKPFNKRTRRKSQSTNIDRLAWQQVKKPKKVKPGYKKKMKKQQEAIKRNLVQQKQRANKKKR